jgi:endoglucanase
MKTHKKIFTLLTLLLLSCSNLVTAKDRLDPASTSSSEPLSLSEVKLNQVGYQINSPKVAIVPKATSDNFSIVNAKTNEVAFTGKLEAAKTWPYSHESVRQADFSEFKTPGLFKMKVEGLPASYSFLIGEAPLLAAHSASAKAFYFNRSGIEITKKLGGQHARAAGHPDTEVKIHKSARSKTRRKGTVLSGSKGWYDAGDYGKYVVNSGISTATLLMSYVHYSDFYQSLNLAIPESNDSIPDLINEIKWNLDWLETMQDEDGGVYHKLTAKRFSSMSARPEQENQQRYMIGKSVTATLDFAAVMAMASRVMIEFEDEFPGASERYKELAVRAYNWAQVNPKALYKQPRDIKTGAYDDENAEDEFAWAAAELFITVKDESYLADFYARESSASANLSWPSVGAIAYLSLTTSAKELLPEPQFESLVKNVIVAAEQHYQIFADSAYDVAISKPDFVWGSNGDVLNNGIVLIQAYRLSGDEKYLAAAMSTVDYVFGKNATGYSFVTGYGDKTPMNIHHRPSSSDNTDVPVPGFLAGGPHSGQQDECEYPSSEAALSYSETVCSYATNEVAINWNAPLVYMLAAAVNERF